MNEVKFTSETGSIWRKWDLHLHTPFTKLSDNFQTIGDEDIWTSYCKKIEESDVHAFGITDYFSCENYYEFLSKFKELYPSSAKVFFPNIEFRLDIAVNAKGEEINIHVIFSNEIEKQQIDDFLTTLKTNHTNSGGSKVSCKNLQQDQFVSATINHNSFITSLQEVFGNDKPYIVLAAANNAGLRPVTDSPRKLSITDEIDKICDAFFGGRQNVKYYLNENRYETAEIAKASPVICGCDAHSFEDIDNYLGKFVTRKGVGQKDEILKDVTWIKSDLTFEGLKQIKHEPQHRVIISENKPRNPVRRVESIKFNFPSNTYIQRVTSKEQQDFCLKKTKQPIYLSDYFTCIIGGRGTGKSTIINLLAEKLGEKTDFFERSNLKVNGAKYDIENDPSGYIEISGTNEIEFVSQGKIEKLAEANELTKLIFNERIKETESEFIQIESDYQIVVSKIDENIALLFNLIKIAKTIKDKRKEKDTIQKIIDSINDKRYIAITGNIKRLKQELIIIEKSQNGYNVLLDEIKVIIQNHEISEVINEADKRVIEIVAILSEIDEIQKSETGTLVVSKDFNETNKRVEEIKANLVTESQHLRDFFHEKGTNEETIKDSQKASENLSKITADIESSLTQITRFKALYVDNSKLIDGVSDLYDRNNTLIKVNLAKMNKKLKVNDENVLDISFTYDFNLELFKDELFKEFYSVFSGYHMSGTSDARVKEVLFSIAPNIELLELDYSSFIERLNNTLTENNYRKENNYVKIVLEIFAEKGNHLVYLSLIKKHLYDLSRYIKINGFYGSRELESCSFGQRCTAVIVTLLMTGVKPLVIDEPEAHLDNKLVADYLVGLVKEKQFDRQIIFASHNSNFVINGDSALIHILEIPNNEVYTQTTSTTIENISSRDRLLKLEGGKEAFLNRESKYGI